MREDLLEMARSYLQSIPDNLHYVTSEELQSALESHKEDYFILDNRDEDSFRAGHIDGAVNLPLWSALDPENLDRIPHGKKVVVVCWVGHTASQLLSILRLIGYDAVGLKYGMGVPKSPAEPVVGWSVAGYPVVTEGDGG